MSVENRRAETMALINDHAREPRHLLSRVELTPDELTEAACLWLDGFDSVDIASSLELSPAAIANALPAIRAEARS